MSLPTYEQLLHEANLARHGGHDGAAEYFMGQIKRRFAHAEPAFLPSAEPEPLELLPSRPFEWPMPPDASIEAALMACAVPPEYLAPARGSLPTEEVRHASGAEKDGPRETVFVVYEDGSADCERCARARGLDLGDDRVSTWRVGSGGWTAPLACISCKAEIPVVVDALSLTAIIRTDDDPTTDCSWDAWNKANAETIEVDGRAEIESILARDGFYDSGDCGAFARFTLRRVS